MTANPYAFESWAKIPRFASLYMQVTEKIDGTNAQIFFAPDGQMLVGSRTRWITPEEDNYDFAKWCKANEAELRKLGPGRHYGEWWGVGINRGYGIYERRFSLFNPKRYAESGLPSCCSAVPLLYEGPLDLEKIREIHAALKESVAAPGFTRPEGIVVWCMGAFWKITDGHGKGSARVKTVGESL